MATLSDVWSTLRSVRTLKYNARSEAATGWTGEGNGSVDVSEPAAGTIVFTEAGTWHPLAMKPLRFTNIFRWSVSGTAIRLEHLRFGAERPVFLFDMVPGENGHWRELTPHVCSEDLYAASLAVADSRLSVSWSVIGPRRREFISYTYW